MKHKELVALGVALTTQCPYCIEIHVRAGKRNIQRLERFIGVLVFVGFWAAQGDELGAVFG